MSRGLNGRDNIKWAGIGDLGGGSGRSKASVNGKVGTGCSELFGHGEGTVDVPLAPQPVDTVRDCWRDNCVYIVVGEVGSEVDAGSRT